MRLARTLALAALTAIAALAFLANSASAQSIEVIDEATGAHCSNVLESGGHDVTGGCVIHANSTSNPLTFVHNGTSEAATTSCENEFVAHLDENGTGYIDTTETTIHTNPGAGCPLVPCEEPSPSHDELEWPIGGLFEEGDGGFDMLFTFCLATVADTEGAGTACTVEIDGAQDPTSHVISFSAVEAPCHENPAVELSGTWQTNDEADEVELIHDHYPGDSLH